MEEPTFSVFAPEELEAPSWPPQPVNSAAPSTQAAARDSIFLNLNIISPLSLNNLHISKARNMLPGSQQRTFTCISIACHADSASIYTRER